MAKDPAFLFYYQDFLVGTEFFTHEETGAYIKVLCHLADKGNLTKKQVLSICRTSAVTEMVLTKLKLNGNNTYYNERLSVEMEKRRKFTESRRKNALSVKAYAKHMENEDENDNRNINDNINISFEKFWNLYDKKVGKKEKLEKKWNNLSDKDRLLIMDYIPKYKESQPDKKYRKDPQTFFNNNSWKDEIIQSGNNGKQPVLSLEQTADNLINEHGERFYRLRNNFKSPVDDKFDIINSSYYDMKFSLSNKLLNDNIFKDTPELLNKLEKKLKQLFIELNKKEK